MKRKNKKSILNKIKKALSGVVDHAEVSFNKDGEVIVRFKKDLS